MAIVLLMVPIYYLLVRTRLKPNALAIAITFAVFFAVLTAAALSGGNDASGTASLTVGFVLLISVLMRDRRYEKKTAAKVTAPDLGK